MQGTTQKEITLKSGKIVPRGTKVTIKPLENERCLVTTANETFKARLLPALKLIGKKEPSIKKLEKWFEDGICKTPTGETVEIDGEDYKGFPSWAKLLGLV